MLTNLGNSASDALGTSPASGYFLFLFIIVVANTMNHAPIFAIIFVMFYFISWIKMGRKLSLIPAMTSLRLR